MENQDYKIFEVDAECFWCKKEIRWQDVRGNQCIYCLEEVKSNERERSN
jgi:hypothetical protein